MDRRRFLAIAGAGAVPLSGCTGALGGSTGTETPLPHHISGDACPDSTGRASTETTTSVPAADALHRVRLTRVDPVPDIVPLVPSIELVGNVVTRERTARLRMTFRNIAGGTVSLGEHYGTLTYWEDFDPDTGDRSVVLLPSRGDFEPVRPACWQTPQPDTGPEGTGLARFTEFGPTFERCERKSLAFDLFGHPDAGDCLPRGEYLFFDRIRVRKSEESNGFEWEYPWRFGLTVDAP